MKKQIQATQESAQLAVRVLLSYLGEDPDREGLLDTPDRVVRAWEEMTCGYQQDPSDILSRDFDGGCYDEVIACPFVEFHSTCEHHLLPFFGYAHIAYLPAKKNPRVVGLSKMARLVECFARRLQIQEKMTVQIADAMQDHLHPQGVAVVIQAKHLCYDEQTEILTRRGFVRFKELDLKEEVAQYDLRSKEISYVVPSNHVRYPYKGRMIKIKGLSFDLLVTPDHRCPVQTEWKWLNGQTEFDVVPAQHFPRSGFIPRAGVFKGKGTKRIFVAGVWWDTSDFCRFMGAYLSEGNVSPQPNRHYVRIVQNRDSRGFLPFSGLFQKLPFRFSAYDRSSKGVVWQCHNKALAGYLRRFGKSHFKYIPQEIKDLPLQERMTFLHFYFLGDGHENDYNGTTHFTTVSKRMADDLHHLLTISGFASTRCDRKTGAFDVRLQNYGEGWDSPKMVGFVSKKRHVREVFYNGEVFCVSVPTGAVVVRRNGKTSISGNCMACRGVQKHKSVMVTSAMRGVFRKNAAARSEFFRLIDLAAQQNGK